MKTLNQLVKYIKEKYPQKLILIPESNYNTDFKERLNPKYLFRGEKVYPTTTSSFIRLKLNKKDENKLAQYILDLGIALIKRYFKIVNKSDAKYWPYIYLTQDILQHYGFPLRRLDFTEDIEIAAFFASHNNTKGGRIWIIETKKLIKNKEEVFKQINNTYAKRPSLQKAYAIRMYDDKPDLQNQSDFDTMKFDFKYNEKDAIEFTNKYNYLLSTKNDEISDYLINYINNNKITNEIVMRKLEEIKNELLSKKNW